MVLEYVHFDFWGCTLWVHFSGGEFWEVDERNMRVVLIHFGKEQMGVSQLL